MRLRLHCFALLGLVAVGCTRSNLDAIVGTKDGGRDSNSASNSSDASNGNDASSSNDASNGNDASNSNDTSDVAV
ncbi:MAG TPA: hypothetical protein VIM14_11770, partial [Polyangia bacterium]